MTTPVALFVFNRPDCTEQVLAAIRRARPSRLYVVADGARVDRPGEAERCALVRSVVTRGVDWGCEVRTNFADRNLGCGCRVSSGIDWVFGQEDQAVFLEDDCLPDDSFFAFCAELLARYRDEPRVGQICGSTFVGPAWPRATSYVFSRYGPVWGWASWRRAWQHYDFAMKAWPALRAAGGLRRLVVTGREARRRTAWYDAVAAGRIDTWDYQWGVAKLQRRLWSAIPTTNLVTNIGFGADGTHAAGAGAAGTPRQPMRFPLAHPAEVRLDDAYDAAFAECIAPSWLTRVRRKLGGAVA